MKTAVARSAVKTAMGRFPADLAGRDLISAIAFLVQGGATREEAARTLGVRPLKSGWARIDARIAEMKAEHQEAAEHFAAKQSFR